jgi:hypothetical protein
VAIELSYCADVLPSYQQFINQLKVKVNEANKLQLFSTEESVCRARAGQWARASDISIMIIRNCPYCFFSCSISFHFKFFSASMSGRGNVDGSLEDVPTVTVSQAVMTASTRAMFRVHFKMVCASERFVGLRHTGHQWKFLDSAIVDDHV